MSLAAMQPYLFPYLGYFQLMDCVDTYLFCEKLQYMKDGWVNRNRLLVKSGDNVPHFFSFVVQKDDYKKNIDQRYYRSLRTDCKRLEHTLCLHYNKAVNFEEAYSVIEEILRFEDDNVAAFNINANRRLAQYLGIQARFLQVGDIQDETFQRTFADAERVERVIYFCHYLKETHFVNAINGQALYDKAYFAENGIDLKFIQMDDMEYPQQRTPFIPNLSIIDVIMNNKREDVRKMLKRYRLV